MTTKLQHIERLMNETTDPKELANLKKEFDIELLAERAEQNRIRIEAEKLAKEKYERSLAEHLAKREKIDQLQQFLDKQEGEMLTAFAAAIGLVELRSKTFAELRQLVLTVNKESANFGTEKLVDADMDIFQGQGYDLKPLARAVNERVLDLFHYNASHDLKDRIPVIPENLKIHSTKWGIK